MAKNKEKDLKDFVEKIDSLKKMNPKDISSDQDLSLAVMNLIEIETHLIYTGAKTGKTSYYDIITEVRAIRKKLMQKLIPHYEGEVWCTSKHLLAACMRIMEVGSKQQDLGNAAEAYKLYDNAYELYCLFWGLNMGAVNLSDVKWANDTGADIKEIQKKVANMTAPDATAKKSGAKEAAIGAAGNGMLGKLKNVVKSAVNCCIE